MYESPLSRIYEEIQTKIIEHEENQILQAVQNCGITVDKEELTRALMYDRQQYEKGYADAKAEERWIPCSERLPSDEDYDETFTVTIQCEHYDDWDDYVTGYADWTPHGWDIQSCYIGQIKVIAWMSLPEPYKGEA